MIALWKSCAEGERPRLSKEDIENIIKNSSDYISKISKTYSQIRAKEILRVSRQTIIHWMNKEWLDYIIIGDVRKPLKKEIDKMVKYHAPRKSKTGSNIYKAYFVEKGVWQEPAIGKKKKVKKAQKRIESLEGQVEKLQKQNSESNAETTRLKKENARLQKECTSLQQQKEISYAQAENLSEQLVAAKDRIGSLETQVTELGDLYSGIKKEKSNISKELTAEKGKVRKLTKRKETLTKQRDQARQKNKEYKAQITAYKNTAKIKKKGYDPKKSPEYAALLEQKKAADAKASFVSKELGKANKRIGTLEDQVDGLVKAAKIAEGENTVLRAKVKAYEKQGGKKGKTKPEDDVVEMLRSQLEQLNDDYTKLEQICAALAADNRALKAQRIRPKKRTKETIRIYRPSEIYTVGERVRHEIWETDGTVQAAHGGSIDVLFDDPYYGARPLTQGKKLKEL